MTIKYDTSFNQSGSIKVPFRTQKSEFEVNLVNTEDGKLSPVVTSKIVIYDGGNAYGYTYTNT